MRLGIDFGTTNSGIALYDEGQLYAVRTNPENENPFVLPSLIYVDRNHQSTVGIEAAFEYLEHDTGRPVKWQKQHVGVAEITVAGRGADAITYDQDLYALVDTAAHGRLLQSIKTILRSPTYEGTRIFDHFYTVDELIELLLAALKRCAEDQFGKTCESVVVGRPVKFSDDPNIDARAEEIIYTAAWFAGFRNITFATEPLAVTYLHHVNSPQRNTSLVFDFGGGTLDLTVARVGGDEPPEILANRGVLVGGDDLDKAIMKYLTKYFGRGATVGDEGRPFPDDMLDLLTAWQTMSDLSRPQHLDRIRSFRQKSSDPRAMQALETLVTQNLGFQLFRTIEQTKRQLSDNLFAKLDFVHGPIAIHEVLTRDRFEQLIARELREVQDGVCEVIEAAGLTPNDIDVVLRTGGSSAVPAFVNMLASIFDEDKLTELEPLVSVVGGMAVIAQRNERPTPAYVIRYEQGQPIMDDPVVASGGKAERYYFRTQQPAYVDNAFAIDYLPANLSGMPAIRFPFTDVDNQDDEYLSFELNVTARVYVGYEGGAINRPRWLRDWQRDETHIEIADGWRTPRILKLYSQVFEPGTVTLGGTKARGYEGNIPVPYVVIVKALE